jgi:hypothetical protein
MDFLLNNAWQIGVGLLIVSGIVVAVLYWRG